MTLQALRDSLKVQIERARLSGMSEADIELALWEQWGVARAAVRAEQERQAQDAVAYGIGITLGGQRIKPEDFFA